MARVHKKGGMFKISIGVHRLNRVPTKKIALKDKKPPQTNKINWKSHTVKKTLSQSLMHCCYNMYDANYYTSLAFWKSLSSFKFTVITKRPKIGLGLPHLCPSYTPTPPLSEKNCWPCMNVKKLLCFTKERIIMDFFI